jgi:hypothetical protein
LAVNDELAIPGCAFVVLVMTVVIESLNTSDGDQQQYEKYGTL